jgi:hypothetical protein
MKRKTQQDNSKIKDPAEWTTGEEPMTGPQDSYLHTLAREAGEPVGDELTKAEASEKIDELQSKTGRGKAKRRRKTASKDNTQKPR